MVAPLLISVVGVARRGPQALLPGADPRMPVVPVLVLRWQVLEGFSQETPSARNERHALKFLDLSCLRADKSHPERCSRQGRHDHGSGRGTWFVEGPFRRIVVVVRRGGEARWSDLLARDCMLPMRGELLVIQRCSYSACNC